MKRARVLINVEVTGLPNDITKTQILELVYKCFFEPSVVIKTPDEEEVTVNWAEVVLVDKVLRRGWDDD